MALPFTYTQLSDGLNTKAGAFLTDEGSGVPARDALNVQATTAGALVKRAGLVTFASPAAVLTSLYGAEETASPFLIAASGTSLFSISAAGAITTIKTGLTTGLRWDWLEAPQAGGQGPVFGMNGTDTPQQWTGAGSTTAWTGAAGTVPLAVPNGTMCVSHSNRVWVAGVAAHPSRLYFSSLSAGGMDATNWSVTAPDDAGAVDIDPSDGEPITGLGVVGPYLLVGKRHKLFVVYDANTGANRRVSASIGVAAHRSIANSDAGTYFLSMDRGVYVTDGSRVELVSDAITPTMNGITPAQRATAVGAFFQGHYYLSYADGTAGAANSKTLDFDTVLKSWWAHGFGSNEFTVWHPAGADGLYSAKATSAIVDQCFVAGVWTDNGQPMPWVWRSAWQSPSFYRRRRFPTPYFRKRWRQLRIEGSGTVDLYLADDFAATETLIALNIGVVPSTAPGTFGGTGIFGGTGTFGVSPGAPSGAVITTPPGVWKRDVFGQGVALAKSIVFAATSTTQDAVYLYELELTDRKDAVVS